jgi:hypothetical protein
MTEAKIRSPFTSKISQYFLRVSNEEFKSGGMTESLVITPDENCLLKGKPLYTV